MMRVLLGAIAVCIAIATFYFLFFDHPSEIPISELRKELPPLRSLSFSRSFEDGAVFIEGTVSTYDVCETANASAVLSGNGTVQVAIDIPPTDGPCLRRKSEAKFSVALPAPEESSVEFMVNGSPVHAIEL